MDDDLRKRLSGIKILALDFDGTLTDGFVWVDQDGKERVRCSRRDSMGTNMLQKNDIHVVVISKETNPVVWTRCNKMNIDCYSSVKTGEGKLNILKRYAQDKGCKLGQVAYVGDDINDLDCIRSVGAGITVADGHPECRKAASYITERKGGDHAVREVCELILEAQGIQPRL